MAKDFTKKRVEICEKLMLPEVKEHLNLPLDKKVEKTKEIIKEAIKRWPKVGLGFSGGTDSLVLLHIALACSQDMPIIFVNTMHQFPETYEFIEKIKKGWNLKNFHEVKADEDRLEKFKEKFGFKTPKFTTICCAYHKIAPLKKAIAELGLDAFIAGIRGVEHEERAKEKIFSERKDPKHIRVHPLLFWKQEDVLDYVKKEGLETNPLYSKGYTSLGCIECTEKNLNPNAHERAGRGIIREEVMEQLREMGYT